MKTSKERFIKSLNQVNEQYVDEANPNIPQRRTKVSLWIKVVAACLCFALALSLVLFIPFDTEPSNTSQYADSAYYSIIEKLNKLTFVKPEHKNNFEVLSAKLEDFFSAFSGAKMDYVEEGEFVPEVGRDNATYYDAPTESQNESIEVTDNQVKGVIEADRIKRTNSRIFYLYDSTLEIFSIDKENTEKLGEYSPLYADGSSITSNKNKWEFYLSKDGSTVTMVIPYTDRNGTFTKICCIDVSEPQDIKEIKKVVITGNYISSRLVDGKLLVVSEFVINKDKIDFSDEKSFLPQIDLGNGIETFSAEDIIIPDEINNARYTIATVLGTDDMKLKGSKALLSYTDDIYVSKERAYLFRVYASDYTPKAESTNTYYARDNKETKTEITCLNFSNENVTVEGKAIVNGYIKDQYSLDEYEGILRVVTTINTFSQNDSYRYVTSENLMRAWGNCNASLFCIDISSWTIASSVEGFAPPHEEVQSVRFDGKTAYVCTSIEMSDPVFFFDLSDINKITYKETGNIEGYSSSLVNFGEGYLMGIGVANWSDFKIEVYEEASDSVVSVCSYIRGSCKYSKDYKSYYIDRENQLIGLGVTDVSDTESEKYIVLRFNGYELEAIIDTYLAGDNSLVRGVYIDGYMYMFGCNEFKVEKIN